MNALSKTFPGWVWLVYLVLFALSIPWYLPASMSMKLIVGLPLWLLACILAIVGMAIFSIAIIQIYWIEEEITGAHQQEI